MADLVQDDLFHLDRALTPKERKKLFKSTRTKQHGHAYPPGTGPEGETCGTCKHACRFRRYIKCGLNRSRWTGGYGTDIRAKDASCKFWEKAQAA